MKKKTLLAFMLCVFALTEIFPQGFNTIVSPDGNIVYAAGNLGKIFRSDNGGQTFASYTINNLINYISGFSRDSLIWFTGSDGVLYRTNKSVLNLTPFSTGAAGPINSVYFLNTNSGFICGDNGVVLKTSNGGVNWTSINLGLSTVRYNSICFLDDQKGVLAGDSGRLYLTTNGGINWSSQTSGTTRNLLKTKYFADGIAVAGEYGIFLIKRGAGIWATVNMRIETDIRSLSGINIDNVHLCGGGGFIRNNKSNSDKFLNFEINPMLGDLKDIIYTDSLTGFAVSSLNQAIIKTSNSGASWTLCAGTTVIYSWVQKLSTTGGIGNNLCKHPYDRNSVFCMWGNRVYGSRNRGEVWTQIATTSLGTAAHSFYVSPVDTNIWLAAIESNPDKVIRTTDYGVNWSIILSINFSNYGSPLEMDQNNPSVFYYAPDGGGFYKSSNSGANFTEISGNYPFRSPCDIAVMYDSSNVIFVADGVTGSGLGNIFKTDNGGVNWRQVQSNTSSSEIPALCNTVFDRSIMYATNWSGGAIYKTTDYGDNWFLLRTNPASGWAADICREDPTFVLTGSYGGSTFLSLDAGANFSTILIGGGSGAGQLAIERGYVLDMRSQGLFKLNANYSVITSIRENVITGVPSKFTLYQNYPNPFNPSTTIKFDLPVSGFVKLRIYNILGREISTLVNEIRNAGTYEINYNASALSTGIYFYKLEFDGKSEVRKFTLIK
jgi:photosystem II stability/assembly factor-like uncharacterized protein